MKLFDCVYQLRSAALLRHPAMDFNSELMIFFINHLEQSDESDFVF